MQRPFAWTTVALLAGAAVVSLHECPGRLLLPAFLSAWLLALLLTLAKRKFWAVFFTLASSSLLGACLYLTGSYEAQVPDKLAQEYCLDQPAPMRLRGLVSKLSPSAETEERVTFLLEVQEMARDGRLNWIPIDGRALVNWYEAGRALREGDYVEVSGKIRLLKGFKNPDIFDYERFMYRRGIYTRMVVRGPQAVALVRPVSLGSPGGWRYLLRQKGMEILSRSTRSFETNAFLAAVLLGERAFLTDEMKGWFKETGTFHILSISGLHIGLVYLIASLALSPLFAGVKKRAAIALAIVWVYALVTGADLPVMRASIMLTLVLAGYLLDREGDFLTAIAVAAFVLFIFDPLSIDDVSFQLSFAAVVFLCSFEPVFSQKLYPLLQRALPFIPSTVMHKFAVTLFASVVVGTGLTPIIAYHFNQVSLVFPLANLLVVPLLSVALALGFGCIVAGFFSAKAAWVIGLFAELACRIIFEIVRIFSKLTFSSVHIASPPLWVIATMGIGIFFLYWRTDWRKKTAILSCIVCAGSLSAVTGNFSSTDSFRTIFFDVGDADSCLIEFPENKKMLIDTGFSTPFLDCGESLIAPFLWRNNINRLDMVVLTHPDADHCGGAPFLFKNFSVDRLILPDSAQMRPKFAPLIELASSRGAAVEFHNAGDVLVIAPKSHVEVLHPPAAVPPGQYSDNDLSLILKVTHHDLTMLFSGDATKKTFDMMESAGISPTSMILKAPHHGLPSSYSRRFIEMVKPEFVIISGRAFRSNDSIKRRISRYRLLCPQVFSTQENGAIIIERDQEDFTVRACRGSGSVPVHWPEVKKIRLQ